MSKIAEGEEGMWRFSHVGAYTENVCETHTDQQGKIHYCWVYPDGKMEYICACH